MVDVTGPNLPNADPGPLPRYLELADSLAAAGAYLPAVHVLYRAVDRWSEEALLRRGFPSRWETPPAGVTPALEARWVKARRELGLDAKSLRDARRLGTVDRLILLGLLGGLPPALSGSSPIAELVSAAAIRHNSWLAHGAETVTREQWETVRAAFRPLLTRTP
jgi:hypothetical protein